MSSQYKPIDYPRLAVFVATLAVVLVLASFLPLWLVYVIVGVSTLYLFSYDIWYRIRNRNSGSEK